MSQNVNMEPTLHSGNMIILAIDEEAIWRMKHTSLPHHIRARVAIPVDRAGIPVYIYRKHTGKIIATGNLEKINTLGKFCWEYVIHPWKNLRKHMSVSEIDPDSIGWIIDAENGLAARPQVKIEPFKFLWVKPDGRILSDRDTVIEEPKQRTLPLRRD